MLRMTPGMSVWRPADLMETAVAWKLALEHHNGPTSLLLSRQNLPALPHNATAAELIKKGGYIIMDCDGTPDAILIATGSEVQLALAAAEQVKTRGLKVRVVSMPCAERFLEQDQSYKNEVLPQNIRARIAIEAASSAYWYQFVGLDGAVIGLDRFGVSAPASHAYQYLDITVEHIIKTLEKLVQKH
jgi:transketolase